MPQPPRPTAAAPIAAIGIGASAGGLRPLREIVEQLPADLSAAVFVVLHVAANGTSVLPQILQRVTALEVVPVTDGMPVRPGTVLVAPPDRHLVAEAVGDHVVARLARGPRENGVRPATDSLLRSLAAVYGARAAGLILSGTGHDGTLGLAEVKRAGGVALVQDPDDAEYSGMPAAALAVTAVDGALPVAGLAAALTALARGDGSGLPAPGAGAPGHALGVEATGALRTAALGLEDRAAMLSGLADRARTDGHGETAVRFDAQAHGAHEQSQAIRAAIGALRSEERT